MTLLREIVRTDFKLRYQSSVLGYIWSLLRPMFMFAIMYLIFGVIFKAGTTVPHFPMYLLLGILIWTYFAEVTQSGLAAIVGKGDLLRKLNFPKYVVIFAGSASGLINLGLNSVVLTVIMIWSGVTLTWASLWLIPLLVELIILGLGVSFLLSTVYVQFRDLAYIWDIVLQAGFYLTPILYPFSLVTGWSHEMAKIQLMSPLAQIIQDARNVLITPQSTTFEELFSSGAVRLIPICFTVLFTVASAWYFRRQSGTFAERV